jgi:RNA polymerase sigma-70 factor, ECF subfamily
MEKINRVDEFVALYTQHSLRMRGFVRALVPTQPDAEDVFQDISRTLWDKFDDFESGTNFLAWALSVARFKVLHHRRVKARLPLSMSDTVFDIIADEMVGSANREDSYLQYLNDCMRRLPERDRELIHARYRHGGTTKTVAQALNRSVDSVYRALRRIHRNLLACVERRVAEEGALG